MNRIRKVGDKYQVLITPDNLISPDSSILYGNWSSESLQKFYIKEYEFLEDAQNEALNYSDIDWYRLILNQAEIFKRLSKLIAGIIEQSGIIFEYHPVLMEPDEVKNILMDRVMNGGEKFNLRYRLNDMMTFTLINPWTKNLHKMSKILESYREYYQRDDLRIRSKRILDKKIISLTGVTDIGTVYEIRLVPTLLEQWGSWQRKNSHINPNVAIQKYNLLMQKQIELDNSSSIV